MHSCRRHHAVLMSVSDPGGKKTDETKTATRPMPELLTPTPTPTLAPAPTSGNTPLSDATLQLALAHLVEKLIQDRILRDRRHATELLGLAEGELAECLELLKLSPGLQGRLIGRELRKLAAVRSMGAAEPAA